MAGGMKKGDFNEAAKQILKGDPPGTEVWISDTVNRPHKGHIDGYRATVKPDGNIGLKKDYTPS